jgi:hypothetical protein
MFGLGQIVRLFGGAMTLLNKIIPSRDELAGRAKEQAKQAKEADDARKRMEDRPRGTAESTDRDLREGKF